ncbi:MAG: hypothetical protein U1C46_07925 [Bacteroidales bacterium]|nr:hypothetical protein [Bacteroidales bacterium]MDZ4204733.1 hypothetical protein [Bacteroidales bacterium]
MNNTLKSRRETRSCLFFSEYFEEGKQMEFKVLKMITIPGDELYFLLESPGLHRLLLPAAYFSDYGIYPGMGITCLVDKINCTGRIFLEPLHPYFEAGVRYVFDVMDCMQIFDRKERPVLDYTVKDKLGKLHKARFLHTGLIQKGKTIEGVFVKTRKGVLIISDIIVINNC